MMASRCSALAGPHDYLITSRIGCRIFRGASPSCSVRNARTRMDTRRRSGTDSQLRNAFSSRTRSRCWTAVLVEARGFDIVLEGQVGPSYQSYNDTFLNERKHVLEQRAGFPFPVYLHSVFVTNTSRLPSGIIAAYGVSQYVPRSVSERVTTTQVLHNVTQVFPTEFDVSLSDICPRASDSLVRLAQSPTNPQN
jgi:hypothetical protein